ncbi:hypothetical protein L249_0431, partial [Ophiocordyceps polyrhachis-furcata BCC 54312]
MAYPRYHEFKGNGSFSPLRVECSRLVRMRTEMKVKRGRERSFLAKLVGKAIGRFFRLADDVVMSIVDGPSFIGVDDAQNTVGSMLVGVVLIKGWKGKGVGWGVVVYYGRIEEEEGLDFVQGLVDVRRTTQSTMKGDGGCCSGT